MPLIVALDGLTKRYPGGVTALDALTLDVEPGIIGLVGANGAGKSTLIKILLGLLAPTSGRRLGLRPRRGRRSGLAIRQLVGYMPEHDCLPPGHLRHRLRHPHGPHVRPAAAAARERTAEVLRHVGPLRGALPARSAATRRA